MAAIVHARLVVPDALHAAVADVLVTHDAVCNIVVIPGVARQPDGHLVLFDVAREATDDVLRLLREHRLDDHGSIAFEHTELSIGRWTDAAAEAAPGDPHDAVVWSEVEHALAVEATCTASYLTFFGVAAAIAAIGVLIDSPVLIVGAMVVGPDYGPLAAIAYGLQQRSTSLLRRGATTFVVGTAVAVAIASVATLIIRWAGRVPDSYADRVSTGFISDPDVFSVIVAVAAAIAGVVALTHTRAGALVGVLISVTTIPAIANIGVGLAVEEGHEVTGSLAQLGVNVGCLVAVGALTIAVQRRWGARPVERQP